MKSRRARPRVHHVTTIAAVVLMTALAAQAADVLRTQSIQLRQGWNAVFLEVTPVDPAPDAVFADTPIDVVATYWPVLSPAQYISDPDEEPWKKPGWGVWYAAGRPDAFLTSIAAIFGNRAYLIHATGGYTWSVEGKVVCRPPLWQPNSFNLIGASVDPAVPPTFATFFSGADAFSGQRFYRLVDDRWVLVTDPASTCLRPGEAYWVYCRGRTSHQGPLALSIPGVDKLDFAESTADLPITVTNKLSEPVSVTIEVVQGAGDLPLSYVVTDPDNPLLNTYPELPPVLQLPPLPGGKSTDVRVHVRREKMTRAEQSTLLKVSSDAGVVFCVPVVARRRGLTGE